MEKKHQHLIELKKKAFYPITRELTEYLDTYGHTADIPNLYHDLMGFRDSCPLFDRNGEDTLWLTVVYEPSAMGPLNDRLTRIYAKLKTGETRIAEHLFIERVDFCEFGNSRPFRVRVVNQFNDNYDHFYVKVADANRVYGLELEDILSPNRINYLVRDDTLIEEHIAGIPGDTFIEQHFDQPETNRVRLAKEFVKFSQRSFIRLLGDMRSYNYVVDMTPDFEAIQYRVRAIDFDQQTYEGSLRMYLPQFFPENKQVVELCTNVLNYEVMRQYQDEERSLLNRRYHLALPRLNTLFDLLDRHPCSPIEKITQLADELGTFHHSSRFEGITTTGALLRTNIEVELAKTAG
jgi:hypothetical protein